MLRFDVPSLGRCVKLGYRRNPSSRLRYQLGLRDDVVAKLVRNVAMPIGQTALRIEKALHRRLQSDHSDKVIASEHLKASINVIAEIYTADAKTIIRRLLDAVERTDGALTGS